MVEPNYLCGLSSLGLIGWSDHQTDFEKTKAEVTQVLRETYWLTDWPTDRTVDVVTFGSSVVLPYIIYIFGQTKMFDNF